MNNPSALLVDEPTSALDQERGAASVTSRPEIPSIATSAKPPTDINAPITRFVAEATVKSTESVSVFVAVVVET